MTLPAKSGDGQKQLVSLLDLQVAGSQVLRHLGRISGHGTSGALLVGGTSGAGGEDEAGSVGWVVRIVEGGAAVQRVQTVDVEVMITVETVVATLVMVDPAEVVVRVMGHVVRVVMTISVVMSVVTAVVTGGGGATEVEVETAGAEEDGGGASEVGGGGGGASDEGGGGGGA